MNIKPPLRFSSLALTTFLGACTGLDTIGQAPSFSPEGTGNQSRAFASASRLTASSRRSGPSSLWTAGRSSLLGERRAEQPGDILTVVININDQAKISNSSDRKRAGKESAGLSTIFGIAKNLERVLPEGNNINEGIDVSSASTYAGSGSVSRNERVTLRVAATVVNELPNDVLQIEGRQEIRINYELRELTVRGYVRSADISRQNEITYDKIADAQISYGGKGVISSAQQPRYGQQIADILVPF